MQTFQQIVVLGWLLALGTPNSRFEDTHARYFEQLRQRGLFSLAESEAMSKLAVDDLSLNDRTSFTIELSRTLTEHAGFVPDEQRNDLWQRARKTVQDLLDRDPTNPRSVMLRGQLAFVFAAESDWLQAERELRPFDESLARQAQDACSKGIEQLKSIEKSLSEPSRDSDPKKPGPVSPVGPLSHELRTLLHQVRFQLGHLYRNRAELSPISSAERMKNLKDAEQSLLRISTVADEPLQSRAKLMLIVCTRLKNEKGKAAELLATLEKSESKLSDLVQNDVTAERVRLLMELRRPADAVELLLRVRGQRQRLTGELWWLQTGSLIELRQITLEKQQESLADQLAEQVTTAIERCEEQVGGFWGGRCRQLWDNTRTAQKYGVELDTLLQQARNNFTAGRTEAALAEYATAEKLAIERRLPELAIDLGFTRASIMLDGMQYEAAATEFHRLSDEYSTNPRAAKFHLLETYSLGRFYDEKKSQSRREAYTKALDSHLKNYPNDTTVNDARFLKAQLEEQRLQATAALTLYLEVVPEHPRALDAMAGVARCSESILKRMGERNMSSADFELESINRLDTFLSSTGDTSDKWTVTHADIALRLVGILLTGRTAAAGELKQPRENPPTIKTEAALSIRCHQAAKWLVRVVEVTDRKDLDHSTIETNERLLQRLVPLRIVALAGCARFDDAERLLSLPPVSQAQTLIILDRLSNLAVESSGEQRLKLAALQLKAAQPLILSQDQLTPADADRLDRCLVRAYVHSNQNTKAVALGRRMADREAKDANRQRELAILFSDVAHEEAQTLAKQCWRRVEALAKPGTTEWMLARLGVLETTIRLNQLEEANKLFQVTKVLYPDLGGDAWKLQFESIEARLRKEKAGAP